MNNTLAARQHAMLDHALGPVVRAALATPGTIEVMANADGRLWHETHGRPAVCIGTQDARITEAVIRLVAACNNQTVTADQPSLAATLPGGQRFQGFLPPRTKAPAYCIRVPQAQVLPREAYVPQCCPADIWERLTQAVADRETLLLAGGMSSGKTTLMNSLAAHIPPTIRVVTMEDTSELAVCVPNYLQLYAQGESSLAAVVKDGFRTAAQCIPVGELRDGATALQALKLWLAVGGGMATIHAESARQALTRLAYLCAEVSPGTYEPLIGETVRWVVWLESVNGHRRVSQVVKVHTWNGEDYACETVWERGRDAGAAGAHGRAAA
jgi:type IV secretion system protein VirB11